uniref:Uncharacterized protein n=1 Tax=Hemiselmis andersenii TaxID=464988 RepID=A0A6U5AKN7_HEMAN|mmetsp:Transcript_36918/g.86511  ORF Transcript_36918/g.86511 Transcript_36918/m.86511 type:complete len:221 (-) Transcript_36918:147-809(-)
MRSRKVFDTAVSIARALHRVGKGKRQRIQLVWQAAAAPSDIAGREKHHLKALSLLCNPTGASPPGAMRLQAVRNRDAADSRTTSPTDDAPANRPARMSALPPTSSLLSTSTLLLEQKRSIWLPTDACVDLSYAYSSALTGLYFFFFSGAAAYHVVACPVLATIGAHALLKLSVSCENQQHDLSQDVVADRSMAPLYLASGKAGALSLALSLSACVVRLFV